MLQEVNDVLSINKKEDLLNKRKMEGGRIEEKNRKIIWLSVGLGLAVGVAVYLIVR